MQAVCSYIAGMLTMSILKDTPLLSIKGLEVNDPPTSFVITLPTGDKYCISVSDVDRGQTHACSNL